VILTILAAVLGLAFVAFTGAGGQPVFVNPSEVISVREPLGNGHYEPGVRCVLHTSDGKFIAVTETCPEVRRKLEYEQE